jgi:hypothetical protein
MARGHVETSRGRVRRALVLLEELEEQLRALGSSTLPRGHQVRSLAAARRRVRLAKSALGSSPETLRPWTGLLGVARGRASLGGVVFEAGALVVRSVWLLLRVAWRCMRAVLRLAYRLRAI